MWSTPRLALIALGGMVIVAGLVISYTAVGGFEEDLGIEATRPEIGLMSYYSAFRNVTVGILSPGTMIRLISIEVFPKSVGYRWSPTGTMEEFHPDKKECNAGARVWLYEDGRIEADLGNDDIVMGESATSGLAHYVLEYEVKHEEMHYTLVLVGNGDRPFEASAKCVVVTVYGRIAPYLMIGGIALIVVALVEPSVRRAFFNRSVKEPEVAAKSRAPGRRQPFGLSAASLPALDAFVELDQRSGYLIGLIHYLLHQPLQPAVLILSRSTERSYAKLKILTRRRQDPIEKCQVEKQPTILLCLVLRQFQFNSLPQIRDVVTKIIVKIDHDLTPCRNVELGEESKDSVVEAPMGF